MLEFILRTLQRIGLWVGLMFICTPLMIGGLKFFEHSTYVPTQATVLALSTKCDMSYRTSRFGSTHRVVECSEVSDVKSRYPEVNWTVNRMLFVDIAYATPSGQPIRAAVPLSKLERSTANIGEQILILQSRQNPGLISGPANAHFFRLWGIMFAAGIAMFAGSRGIKWLRTRGLQDQQESLLTRQMAITAGQVETRAPTVETPRRQWRPTLPSHPPVPFGQR